MYNVKNQCMYSEKRTLLQHVQKLLISTLHNAETIRIRITLWVMGWISWGDLSMWLLGYSQVSTDVVSDEHITSFLRRMWSKESSVTLHPDGVAYITNPMRNHQMPFLLKQPYTCNSNSNMSFFENWFFNAFFDWPCNIWVSFPQPPSTTKSAHWLLHLFILCFTIFA